MQREEESSLAEESTAIIDHRIEIIESTIRNTRKIPEETRAELMAMLSGLKSELANLSKTHHEEAASITRFADASAHEVSRSSKNPQLADTALNGLRLSIQGLEESHPIIVRVVNRFATALSNMDL